jgi:hypothetical protein
VKNDAGIGRANAAKLFTKFCEQFARRPGFYSQVISNP